MLERKDVMVTQVPQDLVDLKDIQEKREQME